MPNPWAPKTRSDASARIDSFRFPSNIRSPQPHKESKSPQSQTESTPSMASLQERFAPQLDMLQAMGFTNEQENLAALITTQGDVDSAVDHILMQRYSPAAE